MLGLSASGSIPGGFVFLGLALLGFYYRSQWAALLRRFVRIIGPSDLGDDGERWAATVLGALALIAAAVDSFALIVLIVGRID